VFVIGRVAIAVVRDIRVRGNRSVPRQ
jgi:hypothetical protein